MKRVYLLTLSCSIAVSMSGAAAQRTLADLTGADEIGTQYALGAPLYKISRYDAASVTARMRAFEREYKWIRTKLFAGAATASVMLSWLAWRAWHTPDIRNVIAGQSAGSSSDSSQHASGGNASASRGAGAGDQARVSHERVRQLRTADDSGVSSAPAIRRSQTDPRLRSERTCDGHTTLLLWPKDPFTYFAKAAVGGVFGVGCAGAFLIGGARPLYQKSLHYYSLWRRGYTVWREKEVERCLLALQNMRESLVQLERLHVGEFNSTAFLVRADGGVSTSYRSDIVTMYISILGSFERACALMQLEATTDAQREFLAAHCTPIGEEINSFAAALERDLSGEQAALIPTCSHETIAAFQKLSDSTIIFFKTYEDVVSLL